MGCYQGGRVKNFDVNTFDVEIERGIIQHPRLTELTAVELAFILSELAFHWSLQALKAERDTEGQPS
jgi:hypothetical protein